MKRRVNVMFLGGAKRVSMGQKLIAAGDSLGLDVRLFSYELSKELPIASIAEVVIGKRWSDPSLMEHLHATITEKHIDILLPFVDPAVEVATNYCMSDSGCWTPGRNADMAAKMFDKVEADAVFRSMGFPLPLNASLTEFEGMIIAKPRLGSASKGIRVIGRDEFIRMNECGEAPDFLFQEYIADREEFTVDCYVAGSGTVICAVPRRRIEVAGGEVTVTKTLHDKEIEDWSHRILHDLRLNGPVTLQFLREKQCGRRLMLMEINPRLGGGAVCAVHAGADLPRFILQEWLGKEPEPCTSWEAGVKICRYLQEIAFHDSDRI